MKKGIIIVAVLLVVFFIIFKVTKPFSNTTLLIDNENYKDMKSNNIDRIVVNKYTEGGLDSNIYTNKEDINSLYKKISEIKIGDETDKACDDNTTSYFIYFKDGTDKTITIECDWVIIGDKRYLIK